MMEIGGYFDLELNRSDNRLHAAAHAVNTGRNALELILRQLDVKKLYLPYFTCDVLLEPIERLNIPYVWYSIDRQLELASPLDVSGEGTFVLYNNYFGVKGEYVRSLAQQYPGRLIIDNAQALFFPALEGIPSFYSPRKFMGLPDGGYAYLGKELAISYELDYSHDRCSHLLKRLELNGMAGYADFKANSRALSLQPIRQMSALTRRLIENADLEAIQRKRKANFDYLHARLAAYNLLELAPDPEDIPMVYPLLIEDPHLRQKLIDHKVFVATYWPNVLEWCQEGQLEYSLTKFILPLPVDQRYGAEQMTFMVEVISK